MCVKAIYATITIYLCIHFEIFTCMYLFVCFKCYFIIFFTPSFVGTSNIYCTIDLDWDPVGELVLVQVVIMGFVGRISPYSGYSGVPNKVAGDTDINSDSTNHSVQPQRAENASQNVHSSFRFAFLADRRGFVAHFKHRNGCFFVFRTICVNSRDCLLCVKIPGVLQTLCKKNNKNRIFPIVLKFGVN